MNGKWSDVIGHLCVFLFPITGSFVAQPLYLAGRRCIWSRRAWVSSIYNPPLSLFSFFLSAAVKLSANSFFQDECCQCLFKALRTHCCRSYGGLAKASSQREDEKDKRERRGNRERKKERLRVHGDWWMCVFSAIYLQTTDSNHRLGTPASSAVFICWSFSLSSTFDLSLFGVHTHILSRDVVIMINLITEK